jgi:hypothetical protein
MLAYVFWHAAPASIAVADYEKGLPRFGHALADAGRPGFRGHASYAIDQMTKHGGHGGLYTRHRLWSTAANSSGRENRVVRRIRDAPPRSACVGSAQRASTRTCAGDAARITERVRQ